MLPLKEQIGIVGLGAIGGSLALAWRDRAPLIGWSRDSADRVAAEDAGIRLAGADRSQWVRDFADATVVVIAIPLDEVASAAQALLSVLPNDALLLHTASLQRQDALGVNEAEWPRLLGTHPIAGSERSGFVAASAGMFRGATVRAEARATDDQRRRIELLWGAAGIERIVWGDAVEHDDLMSWVSHLPQLTATALAAVLGEQGIVGRDVGPGARDLTRLGSSDPAMWAPILSKATDETPAALRCLTRTLDALASAIESHDAARIAACWAEARTWRRSVAEKPA
jgi:prephenate dehydrogenase